MIILDHNKNKASLKVMRDLCAKKYQKVSCKQVESTFLVVADTTQSTHLKNFGLHDLRHVCMTKKTYFHVHAAHFPHVCSAHPDLFFAHKLLVTARTISCKRDSKGK